MSNYPSVCICNTKQSGVDDSQVQAITEAVAKQVVNDFGPAWDTYASLYFCPATETPPAAMWNLMILDNSDQAGALGYHDLTPAGLPLGKVFAQTDAQYGEHLSVTVSHELLEMLGDPFINLSAQADDGKFYAFENCDAVESDSLGYEIDNILVSDFVLKPWFGHGEGKVDFRGHISSPFQIAQGGYISIFDPGNGQGWTQVQAREVSNLKDLTDALFNRSHKADLAAKYAHAVPRVGSRRERRFRGSSNWLRSTYDQA